jgi:hypothetical protein
MLISLEGTFGESFEEVALTGANEELLHDRIYYELAKHTISESPDMFAWSCVVRACYLWSPLPQRTTEGESMLRRLARYAVGVWYLAVYALALAGLARLRLAALKTSWIWGILLCVAFTALHAVYWSNLRMRAPLMPVVALAAAQGAAVVASRFRRRAAVNPN